MRLAYVEDDRDAREIFSARLTKDGYVTDLFENAESLLNQITPGSYDVLITDIRLSGIDGIRLLEQLRLRNIQTPCILITAFNSLEYAQAALNSNANYLLEKPFKYKDLLSAINKVSSSNLSVEYCVERGLSSIGLTQREYEVAELILKGLSNNEIARITALSEKTVKQHITQIFQKASVSSRAEFFSSIFPV